MKKTIFTFVFVLAAFVAVAQNGMIKDLTGTVELKNAGSAVYVPAKAGDVVKQDTVVSTSFKSMALIEIGSTILTVRPLTRLTLTEIRTSSEGESLNVNIHSGRMRVDVKPAAGTKTIMTATSPTSTASVRGTSFELDTRNLHVISGNVLFKGTRGTAILVSKGSNSTADQRGSAINPLAIGEAAYKPPMPVGTQSNAKPTTIAKESEGEPAANPNDGNFGVGVDY